MSALVAWSITTLAAERDTQWTRRRAGGLLLYINAQDPGSGEIGEMLAKQLRKVLPKSSARLVREPTPARVARAMSTQQGNLAVIAYDIALEMYRAH